MKRAHPVKQARLIILSLALAAGTSLAAAPAATSAGVDWAPSTSVAQVDAAFAKARRAGKPLFLYWGAQWCPPCNQVKATVFNRADFVAESRQFVAVHLDGDTPGAQKLGARFKVSGYPTMVLFNPQGQELTRLPGEVEAPVYLAALQGALAGGKPVADLLAMARRGEALNAGQWRQLAWYSWDTDEQKLLARSKSSEVLLDLAAKAPPGPAATRLQLKGVIAASDDKPEGRALDEDTRYAAAANLLRLLGDGTSARGQMDLVSFYARELVTALSRPGTPERAQLVAAWDQAARRLQEDETLWRGDRLGAMYARVALQRLDDADDAAAGAVPTGLQNEAQAMVDRFDREIDNGYERQAVITLAADLLKRAGRLPQSDALLKANLARSHSPYYLMSQLAGNAKARRDTAEALQWYQRAWETSKGPATRAQWGASYVANLVDLAPDQGERIEKAAATIFAELAKTPDAYQERSARSVQRIGKKLVAWNAQGVHQARLDRIARRLAPVCAQLPRTDPQRATCEGALRPQQG